MQSSSYNTLNLPGTTHRQPTNSRGRRPFFRLTVRPRGASSGGTHRMNNAQGSLLMATFSTSLTWLQLRRHQREVPYKFGYACTCGTSVPDNVDGSSPFSLIREREGETSPANPENSKEPPRTFLGTCLISGASPPVDKIFAVKGRDVDQLPPGLIWAPHLCGGTKAR